ncbi:MAG: NAD-dependent epimerase/dehydratase family protein [Demequina sp.]|nr:NAD-dependent epimerase/dehydratase family protein [Demequina sp.]
MRILVTGADGFVGRHLVRAAADAGHEVHALVQRPLGEGDELRASLAGVQVMDLIDERPAVEAEAVVHLAGLAAVGPSFAEPQRYINANSAMFTNVAEAALVQSPATRIIAVSSGAVYGGEEGLIDETRPVHMTSPYTVAKRLVELQSEYYVRRGLDVIVARPFNHIGPGQRPGFLVPDLAAQLLNAEPGEPIHTGDLSTERDYTDVRDVVAAYLALCSARDLPYRAFNVSSGVARSGHEVLEALCAALGIGVPEVVVDPNRIRPNDARSIVGDDSRLRGATGWVPVRPFAESVGDFLDQAKF